MVQEKETLQEEVKCLKETLAECESDSRKCQLPKPEKPDDYDERLKPLRYENSRLKTELKMSASAVSFQSEEIHELMATTNQLTKKLRKMSLENDDLTLKLAASPNIKKNQENQPDDSDELTQLRDENSKLKTQFEMSSRKVCFQSDEIQELTATINELNKKLWKMSLKNDKLILKLAASRDIASTNIDEFHKTELHMKKEIT
ncbi:kinesin-like protein KIN-7D, mitochondrial [Daphnia pulicaria]|uniref:kinesin-like protein KIN-7D, mitochondrial n=1 Tax=Daphnia pulicaria TaxID=35523 RepID=UPI001EEA3021|nr:kinesin-like protein KIN-7D, mitochondrial [Daphnia pulicaria]